MLFLELTLGFAIGLSLGLLGGGGSILTVPTLVYLVGQTPQAAVTTSLAIVGVNSVMGASFHRSQRFRDKSVSNDWLTIPGCESRKTRLGEISKW